MQLELSDEETALLRDLLESAQKEKLREINHADSSEYKEALRAQFDVLERLAKRLQAT